MIYQALQKGPFKYPGYYDPDSKRLFGWKFRPDIWQAGKVYELRSSFGPDLVLPSIYSGFYHKVTNPGISGVSEPTWATESGEKTEESTGLVWEAVPYNLMPLTITVTSSTWYPTGCTISSESYTDTSTQCRIETVTADKTFTLTNRVTFSNGDSDDYTVRFKIESR